MQDNFASQKIRKGSFWIIETHKLQVWCSSFYLERSKILLQKQDLAEQVLAQELHLAPEFKSVQKTGRRGTRNTSLGDWNFSTAHSSSLKYAAMEVYEYTTEGRKTDTFYF